MLPAAMHVMAGVLLDPAGRVLLAQRPPGKHLAGMWEFPGGKLEPGEDRLDGLARELREELGIEIDPGSAAALVQVPWDRAERPLVLDAWCVRRWHGAPRALEGQELRWQQPRVIDSAALAPADRLILQALVRRPEAASVPAGPLA